MATLKAKSNVNIASALILTSKKETCLSSVHCDYYSCYQLMLYYLDHFYNYTEVKRKKEYDTYKKFGNGKLGSHEYWINEFHKHLTADKKHILNSNIIDKNIRILRENRIEADYRETDISKSESDRLYDIAKNTRSLIDKSFEDNETK